MDPDLELWVEQDSLVLLWINATLTPQVLQRVIHFIYAFLHSVLIEEIHMEQSLGFTDLDQPTHVCRLHKTIYGLKEALRAWYLHLTNYLRSLSFVGSGANTSPFVCQFEGEFIILLIYVDVIVLTSNKSSPIPKLLIDLGKLFVMKDLGSLHCFLGIEAQYIPSSLYLKQTISWIFT